MSEHNKGLLFVSITALFWGILAIALKVGLSSLDSASIVWFRFSFAFLILLAYILLNPKESFAFLKKPPKESFFCGLLLGCNYFCFLKGVELTSPSITQIIIQVGPISLALAGFFYFKESIVSKQVLGFLLALIGFILFYSEQLDSLYFSHFNEGFWWIITGAFSWTIYAILQKSISHKISSVQSNFIIYFTAALLFTPMAKYQNLPQLNSQEWSLMIFLGANTLIAYGCLAAALQRAPANQISLIITLNPLITLFLMQFLSKIQVTWIDPEPIGLKGYIGAFMVITGAIFVNFFKAKSSS